MKIRVALTVIALLSLASACGGEPGTPTANTESAAVESAGSAASDSPADDSGIDDETSTDDDGAMDDDTATGSSDADADQGADDQTGGDEATDQGAVDQGGVDQPGADDDTGSAGAASPGAASLGGAEFCQQLLAAEKQLDSIDQAFGSGDVASADKALTADMDVFQKLAASAPSEIAPAMQDIIAALTTAQKAVSGGAAPDPSAMAGMGNMTGDLTAMGNYIANNCAAYAD